MTFGQITKKITQLMLSYGKIFALFVCLNATAIKVLYFAVL
jgi:hypothetical protein